MLVSLRCGGFGAGGPTGRDQVLARHRVTFGYNPPDIDRFCPYPSLTRAEIASIFTLDAGSDILNRPGDGQSLQPTLDQVFGGSEHISVRDLQMIR